MSWGRRCGPYKPLCSPLWGSRWGGRGLRTSHSSLTLSARRRGGQEGALLRLQGTAAAQLPGRRASYRAAPEARLATWSPHLCALLPALAAEQRKRAAVYRRLIDLARLPGEVPACAPPPGWDGSLGEVLAGEPVRVCPSSPVLFTVQFLLKSSSP